MQIDDKVKEYVDYLDSMLDIYVAKEDKKDIRHIIFKTLKAFYAETKEL